MVEHVAVNYKGIGSNPIQGVFPLLGVMVNAMDLKSISLNGSIGSSPIVGIFGLCSSVVEHEIENLSVGSSILPINIIIMLVF